MSGIWKKFNPANDLYDQPLAYRGTIAPFGTYTNPDGSESAGFAWPGMITEPLNALQRLHENSYTEDGRLGIPNPQYQGNKDDALTALLSIYAGNALNPATRLPENALGMFAGRNAKTANLKALSRAEDMAGKGASREDIWNDTGWFQGADDKWRFEIDDSEAAMKWRKQGLLSKVLKHDDLYAAYPSIGDIKTRRESGLAGLSGAGGYKPQGEGWFSRFFSPASIHYSAYADRPRKTLLHEAQHALQQKEGFARGARSDEYSYIADKRDADIHKPDSEFAHAKKAVSAYADEMMKRDGLSTVRPDWKAASEEDFLRVMDDGFAWDSQRQAYEDRAYADLNRLAYDRSAGEVEARNVQVRADMTPEQRRATPPWLTQDVPFEKQFVQQYGQRSPLPPQPQAPPQGGIRAAWMEPVYPEILPPAPVASTAEDALRWMRESGPIIDGELLSDTGRPSIAGAEAQRGFTAYHGSPHDFDKFDLSKIGSGEGAQAYGHGLYFAENEGVAKSYRDSLSLDGLGVVARGRLRQHNGDLNQTIEYLRGRVAGNEGNDTPFAVNARQALAELESAKAQGINQGHMYQVRINADPEDFLDWDKLLSQQSESVKSRLGIPAPDKIAEADRLAKEIDRMNRIIDGQGYGRDPRPDEAMRIKDDLVRKYLEIDPSESAWWKFDAKDAAARPEAAAKMREAGIPGVKYLDRTSRAAGEGSRNYVVFDDSIIDILKKYGLAGGAIGAGSLFDFNTDQQY